MSPETRRFAQPDEVRRFELGHLELVRVGGHPVGLATYEPGWVWSRHVQPIAGTASCGVTHVGYLLQGRLGVRMDDGTEAEAVAGDVVAVPAGHDGWVVGEEPCRMLDWAGGAAYARA